MEVAGFEGFFVGEGDKECVGEAVVEAFGADVFAPFEGLDGGDFAFESEEGGFDSLDLFGGGGGFELEKDDVAVGFGHGGFGWGGTFRGGVGGEAGEGEQEGVEESFHEG